MPLTASHIDGLTESQAREIIAQVIVAIRDGWMDAADGARLSAAAPANSDSPGPPEKIIDTCSSCWKRCRALPLLQIGSVV